MFSAARMLKRLGVPARGLFCDSRRARRGGVFLAYPGFRSDGRRYIAEALRAGASGVFWEAEGFSWPPGLSAPNAPVLGLARRAGLFADAVYGAPSRRLFAAAVTGTNGKTTASFFAVRLLRQSGVFAGCVGTLGAGTAEDKMIRTDNTTPDAVSLHEFLRDFADAGARAAVLEASSHGIVQRRLAGVRLGAAALLNIGRDHLDYHGNMRSYRRAKARLLRTEGLQTAVVNADDAHCVRAAEQSRAAEVWTFGRGKGFGKGGGKTLRLISAVSEKNGMRLKLDGAWGKREADLRVLGLHNAENFMAAALIALAAGASWDSFRPHELSPPRGRLQRINAGGKPAVYVDYAHTPDALAAALSALRGNGGRLWAVFGCGGARDAGKRRRMGRTAAALADVAIITDDNPRGEPASRIRAQILSGGKHLREIPGRAKAIAAAVADADGADSVLIAGKGHEEYQEINGRRRYFSDEEAALSALSARGSGRC